MKSRVPNTSGPMLLVALVASMTASAALAPVAPAEARSRPRAATNAAEQAPSLSGKASLAVISIKDQRISLYAPDGSVMRERISSGQTGYETPVGVFSILQKKVEHTSNLYDDAQMPYMQRLTWSGVALHAGNLPGYPASHGCVRLPYAFAQQIFSRTKLGMRIVISRDDVAPVEISHPLLLKPEPASDVIVATPTAYQPSDGSEDGESVLEPDVRAWPERQTLLEALKANAAAKAEEAKAVVEHWQRLTADLKKHKKELSLIAKRDRAAATLKKSEAALAKAEARLAKATSDRSKKRAQNSVDRASKDLAKIKDQLEDATEAAAEADKVVSKLKEAVAEAEAAKTAAVQAAAAAKRSTMPVSIFISAKSQKLYVRQGNEAVFDTEIAIANPEDKIGTHVFTAMDYTNGGDDVRWNVVSISRGPVAYDDYDYNDDYDDYDEDRRQTRRSRKDKRGSYTPPATDAKAAAAALERISIPADVRAQISQNVWPGSSIIISDEELSKETGKGTDFIVVASDEPQGALKIRPRRPAPSDYRDYYDDDYYYYRPYRRYRYERRAPSYKSLFWW